MDKNKTNIQLQPCIQPRLKGCKFNISKTHKNKSVTIKISPSFCEAKQQCRTRLRSLTQIEPICMPKETIYMKRKVKSKKQKNPTQFCKKNVEQYFNLKKSLKQFLWNDKKLHENESRKLVKISSNETFDYLTQRKLKISKIIFNKCQDYKTERRNLLKIHTEPKKQQKKLEEIKLDPKSRIKQNKTITKKYEDLTIRQKIESDYNDNIRNQFAQNNLLKRQTKLFKFIDDQRNKLDGW